MKKEYPDDNDADKTNYDDLLSEEVNEADLGFEEGQLYVISNEAESSHRQFEWNLVNKDYLKQVEEENLKRANEDPNASNKRVNFFLAFLVKNAKHIFVFLLV